MFLVLGGVFTLFYAATATIRAIVSGELADFWGKQQMERTLVENARPHHRVRLRPHGTAGVPGFFTGEDHLCRHR